MLQVGFKTNKGKVRSHNEDACYVLPEKGIYIAADGVGGNSGGEVASRTAVYEIVQYITGHSISNDASAIEVRNYLAEALSYANNAIRQRAQEKNEYKGMATTVVLCFMHGGYAYFAHAGDSRAYVIRRGRMTQITDDHTYVNALVNAGIITAEEALTHDKRHMITKALGADEIVEPEYKQVDVIEGDTVLLCTDGLYGELTDDTIATVAGDVTVQPQIICSKLVDMANDVGGEDNITAVCIRF